MINTTYATINKLLQTETHLLKQQSSEATKLENTLYNHHIQHSDLCVCASMHTYERERERERET